MSTNVNLRKLNVNFDKTATVGQWRHSTMPAEQNTFGGGSPRQGGYRPFRLHAPALDEEAKRTHHHIVGQNRSFPDPTIRDIVNEKSRDLHPAFHARTVGPDARQLCGISKTPAAPMPPPMHMLTIP